MPKKKKTTKKSTPAKGRPESEHYTHILLEEIRSQVSGLAEVVQSNHQELHIKIDCVKKELSDEISLTQLALKRMNMENAKRFGEIDVRFGEIDVRFDKIDHKLDHIDAKIHRHDSDITTLKAAGT